MKPLTLSVVLAAVPRPSPEQARAALHEVAMREEFTAKPPDLNIVRWLLQFFEWLASLHSTAPVLYWVLLVGCIVLLALLCGHIVWTIRRVFFTSDRPQDSAAARERQRRLSLGYRTEADACAERGDFTEAVRNLFLALVYRLDESGRVLFRRALTNREYLGLFADRPRVRNDLELFVDVLDVHWYGQRAAERSQYEQCLSVYDQLERTA